jgi:hypothetical protein
VWTIASWQDAPSASQQPEWRVNGNLFILGKLTRGIHEGKLKLVWNNLQRETLSPLQSIAWDLNAYFRDPAKQDSEAVLGLRLQQDSDTQFSGTWSTEKHHPHKESPPSGKITLEKKSPLYWDANLTQTGGSPLGHPDFEVAKFVINSQCKWHEYSTKAPSKEIVFN